MRKTLLLTPTVVSITLGCGPESEINEEDPVVDTHCC